MASQYELLVASNSADLAKQVNAKLALNWKLYGPPFSDSYEYTTRLCQAMVLVPNNTIYIDPETGRTSLM